MHEKTIRPMTNIASLNDNVNRDNMTHNALCTGKVYTDISKYFPCNSLITTNDPIYFGNVYS